MIASSTEMFMVDDYLNYGIGELVTSYNEMVTAVDKITANYREYQKCCDKFVGDYLTNPGTAGSTITNHIANCLIENV